MKLLFFTIGILFSASVIAQAEFSGTWVLNEKQHISGPVYLNAMQTKMKVQQSKDSIFIEYTNASADGKDAVSTQSLALDGKAITRIGATSKRKYIRKLEWSADKNQMIMTTVFYVPENDNEIDFTRIETWSISDGKLMVHKKSIETRSETWEVKGTFAHRQAQGDK